MRHLLRPPRLPDVRRLGATARRMLSRRMLSRRMLSRRMLSRRMLSRRMLPHVADLRAPLGRGARWLRENISIQARFAIWYAALLMVIMLLLSLVTYSIAASQLRASVQQTIQGRAVAIAAALQHEQYAAGGVIPAPTPTPISTPIPPQGTPTPVSTPDPATSAAIQKQLSLTVPEVLGRLDLAFEVLDARGHPSYLAATLGNTDGLPLDVGIVNGVLRGAPGTSYTASSRTGLLAVYVQPLVFLPRGSGQSGQSGQAAVRSGSAQIVGVVLVAKSLDDVNRTLLTLRQVLVLGDIVAILLASLGGWFIAKRGLRPIAGVTRAARAIAINAHAAGLGTRVAYTGPRDEVGELVTTFNDMLAALERVAGAQRRFVQDASHELRAPLTSIKGNLDLLRRATDLPPEERAAMLADAAAEAGRVVTLVNDLLMLARVDAAASGGLGLREAWLDEQIRGRREPIALDEVVMAVFRQGRTQLQARGKDLRLVVRELEPMSILGDPGQIRQVVTILLDNAIKYTPSGGRVCLAVKRTEDGWAELVVEDNGIGITPEDQPHIFERFFRADHARARDQLGSGLGLSIAEWIVQAHGGRIEVESAPGRGSTFTARLRAERRAGEPTLSGMPMVQEAARGEGAKYGGVGILSGAVQPLARRLASSVSRPHEVGARMPRAAKAAKSAKPERRAVGEEGMSGQRDGGDNDAALSSARHRAVKAPPSRAARERRRRAGE